MAKAKKLSTEEKLDLVIALIKKNGWTLPPELDDAKEDEAE